MHKSARGFTLIELLVVVAIIAMLAAIILASLSSARVKGKQAAVLAELTQMRSALALGQQSSGAYPDINSGGGGTGAKSVLFNPGGPEYAQLNAMRTQILANTSNKFWLCTNPNPPQTVYALYGADPASSGLFCRDSAGAAKTYATWPSIESGGNCYPSACK